MATAINLQTPSLQQHVQALQNLAAQATPFSTTSTAPTASAPANIMPTQQVAAYQNQGLGALSTGTGNQTTPGTPQPGSTLATTTPGSVEDIANQAIQNQAQSSQVQLGLAQAIGDRLRSQQQQQQELAQQNAQSSQQAAQQSAAASGGMYTNGSINYSNDKDLSAARNEVLKDAFSYVGDKYVLGGTTHAGIDCSGLVMAVYDQLGFGQYLNSHNAITQSQVIPGVRTSIANLQPGDLVAWPSSYGHIAIYAGNGMIVAAAAPGEGVKYQPVWGPAYGDPPDATGGMMETLVTAVLGSQITGWAAFMLLSGAVMFGLIFGKLYTARQLDISIEAANLRASEWKERYDRERASNEVLTETLRAVRPTTEAATKVLTSLPQPREES